MAETSFHKPVAKIKRKKSLAQRLSENKAVQQSSTIVLPVLLGVVIFALWQTQVLHKMFGTDVFTLPLPTKIASLFAQNLPAVWTNSLATIKAAGLGLLFGSILGYVVAILATFFPDMGKGGLYLVGAFASIPIAALAPVMNNWTKDVSSTASVRSMVSKILVVTLVCAADMTLNAYRGLTEVKPYSEDLMATYAASKRKVLFKLRIPNSVPYIFTALKVSVPASIMTAVVSEYFAEYIVGVGREIRENIVLSQYSIAWVYITAACIIGIVAYALLMLAQSILMKKFKPV